MYHKMEKYKMMNCEKKSYFLWLVSQLESFQNTTESPTKMLTHSMYRSAHSGGINDKKKHVYRQCLYMTK